MMERISTAWTWIKENIGYILGGIIAILGAGWLYQNRANLILRDELKVQAIKNRVEKIQLVSEGLEQLDEKDEEVVRTLQEERETVRREVIEARETAGMSDSEVLAAFRDLGYK